MKVVGFVLVVLGVLVLLGAGSMFAPVVASVAALHVAPVWSLVTVKALVCGCVGVGLVRAGKACAPKK